MRQRAPILLIWLLITGLPGWADDAVPEPINNNWLDHSHDTLQLHTQKAAIWVDHFFGDCCDEEEPATILTRITLGWETSQHGVSNSYARVRAKIKLPNLKERFYLVLSNEEVDEYKLLPLEAKRPQEAVEDTEDNYNIALRWIKRSTIKEKTEARIGLRSGSNIYLLGRHRRYHSLTRTIKLRLTPAIFIDSEYGAGTRLLTELDHLFNHPGLIRFSARGQFDNRSEGIEWSSGLSYTYLLSNEGAVVGGFYLRGESDGDDDVKNYSTSIRLRKQFWRAYLFYEIEPFIDWPASDNYRTNKGIALSIQIVIGE
ncbi:MAG: hypothetical protein OQL18_09165 [Deltaproteobacteria bacterium]|nr:hypothetical protein [Deltaproteobacteria bacterium]